jgi:hypothetical protein
MSVKRTRPRTVNVLGQKFKIKYLHPDDMDDCHGQLFLNSREIRIDSMQPLDEMKRTIIHEVMHAVLGVSGVSEKLDPKTEEAICVAMESGVFAFRVINRVHG